MNLADLQNDMKSREFKSCYILTGEENAVMNIYINKISKILGTPAYRPDSFQDIYKKLKNKSLAGKDNFYVIFNDYDFIKNEKLWNQIISNELKYTATIIFVYTAIDKRSRFYKQYKEEFIEFNPLSITVLQKYIQKDIPLSNSNAQKLAEVCSYSYNRVLIETNKIKTLANAKNQSVDSIFQMMIEHKLIYQPPSDAIFDLVDSICRGQIKRSFMLAEHYKAVEESPLPLVSVLYNNMKAMLQVASSNGTDIAANTGLTGFQIKLAKEKLGGYNIGEMVDNLAIIHNAEKGIKQGTLDSKIVVDYLLINIL